MVLFFTVTAILYALGYIFIENDCYGFNLYGASPELEKKLERGLFLFSPFMVPLYVVGWITKYGNKLTSGLMNVFPQIVISVYKKDLLKAQKSIEQGIQKNMREKTTELMESLGIGRDALKSELDRTLDEFLVGGKASTEEDDSGTRH